MGCKDKFEEALIGTFKDPIILSAKFESPDTYSVVWQQSCYATKTKLSYETLHSLDGTRLSKNPIPLSNNPTLSCQKSSVKVTITNETVNGKSEDVARVWSEDRVKETFILGNQNCHGPVYYDNELGSIDINEGLSTVIYIAEEKSTSQDEDLDKFVYRPDFGEQMLGKCNPVIVELDIRSGSSRIRKPKESVLSFSPGTDIIWQRWFHNWNWHLNWAKEERFNLVHKST